MDYLNLNKNRVLTFFITFLIITQVKAQKTTDMGALSGALFYIGETSNQFVKLPPAAQWGVFYRSNQSAYWALNTSLSFSKIRGSEFNSSNTYQSQRNYSFENFITNFSVTSQFNFSSYYPKGNEIRVVPYLASGLGFIAASGMGVFPIQPEIIFASGIKWNFNKKINFALELNYNYTFTDNLDKLTKESNQINGSTWALKQKTQDFNNDSFISLLLHIAFEVKKQTKYDCNAYK